MPYFQIPDCRTADPENRVQFVQFELSDELECWRLSGLGSLPSKYFPSGECYLLGLHESNRIKRRVLLELQHAVYDGIDPNPAKPISIDTGVGMTIRHGNDGVFLTLWNHNEHRRFGISVAISVKDAQTLMNYLWNKPPELR